MYELFTEYLNTNYKMSIDDYFDGVVSSKIGKSKTFLVTEIRSEMEGVFSLTQQEAHAIVTEWWDSLEIPYIKAEMDSNYRLTKEWRN